MKLKVPPVLGTSARAAFTLMELLVVIAIIAILAALLLQTAGMVQEKAARSRAEGEIKALETALNSYKIDNGDFPKSANGNSDNSTHILITELCPTTTGSKTYFAIPPKMLAGYRSGASYNSILGSAGYLVDPFGNPYHYQYEGDKDRNGESFFDLWSRGKKNNNTEATWIKNW